MSRFRVVIDRLVLRGFDPLERKALVEALERQLEAALSDPAAAARYARGGSAPALRLPGATFGGGPAGARKLGADVARAIAKGAAS